MASEAAVILTVRDVGAASSWYCYVLSFRVESERVGLNGLPVEAQLRRPGGPALRLIHSAGARRPDPSQAFRLTLRADLGGVAARAADVEDRSRQQPSRSAAPRLRLILHDPDGHELVLVHDAARA